MTRKRKNGTAATIMQRFIKGYPWYESLNRHYMSATPERFS
jgi:hypothetical protein